MNAARRRIYLRKLKRDWPIGMLVQGRLSVHTTRFTGVVEGYQRHQLVLVRGSYEKEHGAILARFTNTELSRL